MDLAVIDATAGRQSAATPTCRYATRIANLPLISHVLADLAASGIRRAQIVAAPDVHSELDRILDVESPRGIAISYLDAGERDGRIAVLAEAARALRDGPIVLHPGDSLFRTQLTAMRARFQVGDVDSVLPEQSSSAPPSIGAHSAVDAPLLLGPRTRPLLEELLLPSCEGEDLIRTLLHSDCRLAVCEQSEHWRYCDSTACLLSANRMVLDQLPGDANPPTLGETTRLSGRFSISDTAFVSNCTILGPVSIDQRAVVQDSFIGPYTAIGAGAVISGAELENTMVLSGAEISHPGLRIEGSIIGERSRITRSFELPAGLHAHLGPDSHVSLSS